MALAIIKNRGSGNIFINGAFEFDQEKEGGSYTSSGNYCLDQWMMASATSCLRASVNSNEFGFVLRSTATAANNRFMQRIERARIKDLLGKELTVAVYAQVISGSWSVNPIKCRVNYANALDNFSTTTNVIDSNMTAVTGSNIPDGTRRRFYLKFTVTQQMVDYGFHVEFGDYTNATNVVEYSMASLVEGGLCPFERAGKELGLELKLCQRYYEKSNLLGEAIGTTYGYGSMPCGAVSAGTATGTASSVQINAVFKTTKRTNPSVSIYSSDGTLGSIRNMTANTNLSATENGLSSSSARIVASSAPTDNNAYSCHWVANARL
jgi:hypothetical protein